LSSFSAFVILIQIDHLLRQSTTYPQITTPRRSHLISSGVTVPVDVATTGKRPAPSCGRIVAIDSFPNDVPSSPSLRADATAVAAETDDAYCVDVAGTEFFVPMSLRRREE
jgi:hypothetical protein